MGGDIWDILGPIGGTVLGSAVGMPWLGAAIGSGVTSGVKTGSPLAGLASAAGSYAGSSLGSGLFGGETIGGMLGDTAANVLPSAIGGASLGSTVGSSVGSSVGEGLFAPEENTGLDMPGINTSGQNAPAPFTPKQENELNLPGSLSQFSGLSPIQLGSNIATGGVYGGGQGPEESNYFENMINRRLVDQSGNVDQDFGDLAPIETSYLDQLGFGGKKNPRDLLEALSGRSG